MRKTKILLLNTNLGYIGGAEVMLLSLAPYLNNTGKYYAIACSLTDGGYITDELKRIGVQTEIIGMKSKFDLIAIYRLCKLLKQERMSIVQTYLYHANIIGRLVAKIAGVPIILSGQRSTENWRKWYHSFLDRITISFVDLVISNSEAGRQLLIERDKIPAEKIIVIPNGIDLKRVRVKINEKAKKQELGLNPNHLIVGTLSRLEHEKGIDILLEAVKLVLAEKPEIHFLIAGGGKLKQPLMKMATALGVEKSVSILGERTDALELLKIFDIFVLSSRWEGMPMALLEAMAMGKPIVTPRVGEIEQMITDGVNGLLVPPAQPQKLAEGILKLLNNRLLADKLGNRAKKVAEEQFSFEAVARQFEEVCNELIARKIQAFEW